MKDPAKTRELLRRIAEGDENALRDFYNIYVSDVFRFTRYFISQVDICEEIVSDVFISLWMSREKLSSIGNIEAYLFTLSKNKSYNYLDKVSRAPSFTSELPLNLSHHHENPEDFIITEELESAIKSSIEELPERCKLVFILSREKGLSYKDIAQILSISEKTVNAQIVLALRKLHQALARYLQLLFF